VLWAGDTRVRVLSNTESYGGSVSLITVTAPGRDVLPGPEAMHRWNSTAPGRWRKLNRAASQETLRRCGRRPSLLVWTWEYQRRGALHKHLVVGVETAAELAAAHVYVQALHRLASEYGFGFVDRGRRTGGRRCLEVIPARRAGRYVAKYLSPLDSNGKPTMSETVTRPDVPPLVVYVARSLTSKTGMTMRYLRWRRKAFVLGLPPIDPATGELLDSIAERGDVGQVRDVLARQAYS
jgi:hypothetical protein